MIYDPLAQYDGFPDENRYIPKSDSLSEFDGVCRTLRARGNCVFLIEEAERYLGQGKPLGENTFDLCNRGRNWGMGITAVTRRIQRLSKDYFDLCNHIFLFRIGLKSREYVADLIGWQLTRQIITLPQYHFLHYNVEDESHSIHVLKLEAGGERLQQKATGREAEEGKEQHADTERTSRVVEGENKAGSAQVPQRASGRSEGVKQDENVGQTIQ